MRRPTRRRRRLHGVRPRHVRIRCKRCHRTKPPSFFARTDIICLVCRRKEDAGVARSVEAPVVSEAVTVALGADRVLRVVVLEGTVVLTQGFALPRQVSPAVSPMRTIHLPLRKLPAVLGELARIAPP